MILMFARKSLWGIHAVMNEKRGEESPRECFLVYQTPPQEALIEPSVHGWRVCLGGLALLAKGDCPSMVTFNISGPEIGT